MQEAGREGGRLCVREGREGYRVELVTLKEGKPSQQTK